MRVVLDASVIVKWLIEHPAREADTEKASAIVESVMQRRLDILQPVHWLAEVAAVVARLSPQTAIQDVEMLSAMQIPTTNEPNVMRRAIRLAIDLNHHLLDTLYHAIAIEHEDTVLITADERYRGKAERHGKIAALRDWQWPVDG